VHRRLAAHRNQKSQQEGRSSAPVSIRQGTADRTAQIAARVAAHFAQAPSYSQLQSFPSEPAPQHEAPLAALPDAPILQETIEPETFKPAPEPVTAIESPELEIPLAPPMPSPALETEPQIPDAEQAWSWTSLSDSHHPSAIEPVHPIPANLIEFPRELVAPRRVRPRRAEGPFAVTSAKAQLSIFELEPTALSSSPQTSEAATAHTSAGPEWSSIRLQDLPRDPAPLADSQPQEEGLDVAPMGRRLAASLIDGTVIAAILSAAAYGVIFKFGYRPPLRALEIGAVAASALAGLIYQMIFLLLGWRTPGMFAARLSLCTFDGEIPSRSQLRRRWGSLLVSVLPVGLGIVWILFDESHLSWHDRLSRTYLRKK